MMWPAGNVAEVQAHPAVPIHRDLAVAYAYARGGDLDLLRANRVAGDLGREAEPGLAAGAHHQGYARG